MNRVAILVIGFLVLTTIGIQADTPVIIVGLRTGPELTGYPDSQIQAIIWTEANIKAGGRMFLDSGGYLGFSSEASLRAPFPWLQPISAFPQLYDTEYLRLTGATPLATGSIRGGMSILASMIGGDATRYVTPAWELGWKPVSRGHFDMMYTGKILYLPEEAYDLSSHALQVRARIDPSIRWGGELALTGSTERWPEWFIYDEEGILTDTIRQDLIASLGLCVDGMLGYFSDWSVSQYVGYRSSSANAYLSALNLLIDKYENRWVSTTAATLAWSPHRSINIHATLGADISLYTQRSAVDSDGFLTDQPLRRMDLGLDARVDWTINRIAFVAVEIGGGYLFSDSPAEEGWLFTMNVGTDFSF